MPLSAASSAHDLFHGERPLYCCVLQPDYSTSNVDYQYFDPPRDLARLLPQARFDHVLLNKLTTYRQLKELRKNNYDIFINLCEGYLEWEVPSIDVIHALETLELPFTGPSSNLYDPPKTLMKYVAFTQGVKVPDYALVEDIDNLHADVAHLRYPLFVKPAKAGDSLGIDAGSRVDNFEDLAKQVASILVEYGPLLVEEYVDGREFTVMVAANPDGQTTTTYKPVEYLFGGEEGFKTYAMKTSELHPRANVPVQDAHLAQQLRAATDRIFRGFSGCGYARLDFRMDAEGNLYFLEINFTCSVFYQDGYEGSADYILQHDGTGQEGFLRQIITEGISRYHRKRKRYLVKGNAIAGYGIYANGDITNGTVLFCGEERPQRFVTRRYIEQHWRAEEMETFRRYAYPVSSEVFLLWDDDPNAWAPQNHSCAPNTRYDGLNVIAVKHIKKGEELTLDYASFLDEHMEPFQCNCGSVNCRGLISGVAGNSIEQREVELRTGQQRTI